MGDELVKVVVTTHNRRDWAKLAIDSVLAQTHGLTQVVVVDDHSTDGTAELLQEYAAAHPDRITVVLKREKRGVGDSVRVGLGASPDAAYVAFLNDDDAWLPEKLASQLTRFRMDPRIGLVYTDAAIIDGDGNATGQTYGDRWGRYDECSFEQVFTSDRACASTLMVRRDVIEQLRPSFPDVSTWDFYVMMVAAFHARIAAVDQPLALYRDTASGLHHDTRAQNADNAKTRKLVFELHPEIVNHLGRRRARRMLALQSLTLAAWDVSQRDWQGYRGAARIVIQQHQLRPIVWLGVHTLRNLFRPRASGAGA